MEKKVVDIGNTAKKDTKTKRWSLWENDRNIYFTGMATASDWVIYRSE